MVDPTDVQPLPQYNVSTVVTMADSPPSSSYFSKASGALLIQLCV